MKYNLTLNEKKILFIVMAEMSPKDPQYYYEFPYLKRREINETLKKLEKLNLIFFDKELGLYRETEEGLQYIDNVEEFNQIKREFDDNFILNYIEEGVLFRIYKKGLGKKPERLVEFPSFKKEEVHRSLEKLSLLKFIIYIQSEHSWKITEEGIEYITKAKDKLIPIIDEFNRNTPPD